MPERWLVAGDDGLLRMTMANSGLMPTLVLYYHMGQVSGVVSASSLIIQSLP